MTSFTRTHIGFRHLTAAVLGCAFALLIYQALALEPRYSLAFVAGILMISAALVNVAALPDLVLYLLAFNLPFASIEKTFLLSEAPTFVISGIPVGLTEICLVTLYGLWFVRIFVVKTESVPRVGKLDWLVLAFWGAQVLSVLTAISTELALLEVVRLGKYCLMYFYLAHNLRRRHLRWLVLGILFSLLVETVLAVTQYQTGRFLGIGRTKGDSGLDYQQYAVTGIEEIKRAEGTTFDSHALGLFLAMALPVPLAIALSSNLRMQYRVLAGCVFFLTVPGLVVSFARASWGAFLAAIVVLFVYLFRRPDKAARKQLAAVAGAGLLVATLLLLPLASRIKVRLIDAPPELLTGRIETLEMAFEMWRSSPWLGIGANNYMQGLATHFRLFDGDPYFIPAHNMLMFVMTELGVAGLVVFLLLCWQIFLTNWRGIQSRDPAVCAIAGALAAAMAALQGQGMFDPIYATAVTYSLFWFLTGWGAGLYRLQMGEENRGSSPSTV